MISFDQALDIVCAHKWVPLNANVPLRAALGRRLGSDIKAAWDSPSFDNSAMDGYAVGSLDGPWTLAGTVGAGDTQLEIGIRQAVRIFTGAILPKGAVAVIPQEQSSVDGVMLTVTGVKEGAHIRFKGEEFRAGSLLFSAGATVSPPMMSALASQGLDCVPVQTRPKVAILSTGSELLPAGAASESGKIFESNSVAIDSIFSLWGCSATISRVADDLPSTIVTLETLLLDHDVLVTIGGVSVGDFDFVRTAAKELGFEEHVSGVAMKPGKPFVFGTRADGKTWFGLPGNPMSTIVTGCLFGTAFLGEDLRFRPLPLAHDFDRKPGREEFFPARVQSGKLFLNAPVGSHATTSLALASGLARVDAHSEHFAEGAIISYAEFPWRSGL